MHSCRKRSLLTIWSIALFVGVVQRKFSLLNEHHSMWSMLPHYSMQVEAVKVALSKGIVRTVNYLVG